MTPQEQLPDPRAGGACQEDTTSHARGSRAPLADLHLQRNPLWQQFEVGFSASKHISLHRKEQDGTRSVSYSGSFVAFCLGLTVAGLIKERVSSRRHLARLFKYLQNVFGTLR